MIVTISVLAVSLPISTITMADQRNGIKILVPMVYEKAFSYEYVHSVEKTPVQEHFVLAPGNRILLTSTHYQSYGVGLPYLPEEGTLVNDNGVFFLSGINRSFSEINLGFMPLAKQALLYHGKKYAFEDFFQPGALLQIDVQKYSPLKIVWLMREGGKS
jgi:hypothetical protein